MRVAVLVLLVGWAVGTAGCSEKPQTAGGRKADAEPWDTLQSAYIAPGWKPGDRASWEAQIHNRAQTQNEYTRAAASGDK